MSMYQHPSVLLVDQYLSLLMTGRPSRRFPAAEGAGVGGVARHAACLLELVRAALDYFDSSHKRRSELIGAAKTLGFAETLQLTEKVRARQEKFKQDKRRGEWKGRKRRKDNDPR